MIINQQDTYVRHRFEEDLRDYRLSEVSHQGVEKEWGKTRMPKKHPTSTIQGRFKFQASMGANLDFEA
jgi:hypothetical protein